MTARIITGYIMGDGAAQNIQIGFVPDYVRITNATDGDLIQEWFRGRVMAFTSGGTTEIVAGMTIKGATSLAIATVGSVLTSSGTWAGGDAAGVITFNEDQKTGTFTTENIYVTSDTTAGINDATIVVDVEYCQATAAAVAGVTTTSMITSYAGSAGSASKGFTIGSVISEEAKVLRYLALGN